MNLSGGTEVSHYRIVRQIGSGGKGTVYLADDLSLGRQVAIKFLKPEASHVPEDDTRLLAEARAAAQHQHPARVTVHEVGKFRDTPYLVMEYVDGTSLDGLLAAGKLEPAQVIEIVSQLCEGLQSAHERGIIHGDIKPSNLMLDRHGRVRILDFGVARLLDLPHTPFEASLSGTLRYIAPEVLTGTPPDPRSDLFSVGVLLYHLLSGRLPFSGPYEAAVAYAIANETPAPLSQLVPGIDPELVAIVERLLDKNPARRFNDAGALRDALQAKGSTDPRSASVPAASRRSRQLRAGAVAILVVGLGLFSWHLLRKQFLPEGQRLILAVLPFDNLGAQGDEYFADGVTDAVTLQLARRRGLSVISRHSAMLYRGSRESLPAIASELGADYLVTGSIHWERATTGTVRINVSLVRAADDSYIWTESFDGGQDRIFELQDDIAGRVAEALHLKVGDQMREPGTRPTLSLAAYDLYLRGNDYFHRSWEKADLEFAGSLYAQAIALDSGFAAAWAMRSRVDASLFWERHDLSAARCEAAFSAARRALELDPELDAAYLALGYCYYHCQRDYEAALAQFQRGLLLHPGQSDLHNGVAAVQRRQGKLQEALDGFQEALRLDPRSHLKALDVGLTLGMLRRYDEALTYVERTTLLAPDYALAQVYRAWLPVLGRGDTAQARRIMARAAVSTDLTVSPYYWWLLRILEPGGSGGTGDLSERSDVMSYYLYRARTARAAGRDAEERTYSDSARARLELQLADQPDNVYLVSSLGVALAGLRRSDSAVQLAQRAVMLFPSSSEPFEEPFLALNLAEILTVFQKRDEALHVLEQVMAHPGFASASYLRLDPLWTPLRDLPRFKALLASDQRSSAAEIP